MLFKGFQITKTTVLIDEGVLVPFCSFGLPYDACCRNELHIDLNALTRILHLFILLRDIFRIGELDGQLISLTEESIQTGNGSGISTLAQFDPEYDQTGVFIPSEHIQNKLDFFLRMLIGMAVGPMRAICQRMQSPIISLHPTVDVLPVCTVTNGSFCNSMFLCVMN